jgi:PqqA peptide cyclase
MKPAPDAPLALIAELTYRCPLKCVYCSNPLEMAERSKELSGLDWIKVLDQAQALGVLQVHLTGGEPAAKAELLELVRHARSIGLYTNLITSSIGLDAASLDTLIAAGLDHVQLSFQDVTETDANRISGVRSHAAKLVFAELLQKREVAFTVNLVVHRHNLERLETMILFAEGLGAQKLEIAHVQYNGWAFANRAFLLPSTEQVQRSIAVIAREQKRLHGKMRIDFVVPDYHAKYPKACMGGWGSKMMLINPYGQALPCHSAGTLPGLELPNVRDHALEWIWRESPVFNRFRGEQWMKEPCRSCDRRAQDMGGCHCQAFLITGEAENADPVCSLSPNRDQIDQWVADASSKIESPEPRYRKGP